MVTTDLVLVGATVFKKASESAFQLDVTFKMAPMTSFHAEKCCRLVNTCSIHVCPLHMQSAGNTVTGPLYIYCDTTSLVLYNCIVLFSH